MGIKEYYKMYLTLHRNKNCIRLHFLGQWVTLICTFLIFYHWLWYLIPIIPFIIYPFAWIQRIAIELITELRNGLVARWRQHGRGEDARRDRSRKRHLVPTIRKKLGIPNKERLT